MRIIKLIDGFTKPLKWSRSGWEYSQSNVQLAFLFGDSHLDQYRLNIKNALPIYY